MPLTGSALDFATLVIQYQDKLDAALAVACGTGTDAERAQNLVSLAAGWGVSLEPYHALQLIQGPFATTQGTPMDQLLHLLATDASVWAAFLQQVQDSQDASHSDEQYLAALTALAQGHEPGVTANDIEWLADLVASTDPSGQRTILQAGLNWIT